MNTLINGVKVRTVQFFNTEGILTIGTLIFLKFLNFYKYYHSKKVLLSFLLNTNNNYFFNNSFGKTIINNFNINKSEFLKSSTFEVEKNSKNFLIQKYWENFRIGLSIDIYAKTIGKGTSGNIKRHNFKRGPVSHGSKHVRLQGSLGSGTTPGRTLPGKRMSGHMGATIKTIQNCKILMLNPKENFLYINGSLPGKISNLYLVT